MGLDPAAPAPKKKIPSIVGVRSDVATPAPILLRQALEGRTLSLRGTRQPRAIRPASPVTKKPESTSKRARTTGPCKSASPSKPVASTSKPAASSSKPVVSRTASGSIAASTSTAAAIAKPVACHSTTKQPSTSEPVPSKPTIKQAGSTSPAATLNTGAPAERAPQACETAGVQAPAPALAVPSANQHNDSTLRVMPLPAPNLPTQRVRVLPMAPRSSIAPVIAIVCLLVAGLAIGVYFALPYVIDWYKSERVPLLIEEASAPVSIVQQRAAGDNVAAPSIGATTDAPPKPKKAKAPKVTKKKVGAAKKPRKQRGP